MPWQSEDAVSHITASHLIIQGFMHVLIIICSKALYLFMCKSQSEAKILFPVLKEAENLAFMILNLNIWETFIQSPTKQPNM